VDNHQIAERVAYLQNNGHAWLTPQVLSSLANSGMSNQDMLHSAEQLRQTYVQAAKDNGHQDAWSVFFHDPVLQKAPSVALAMRDYITGGLGVQPVLEKHQLQTQRSLQAQGFGKDLTADGAWNPDWTAATIQYKQHLVQSQLAGNKPGGFSFGDVLNTGLDLLNPVSNMDRLAGFIKGLPNDARTVIADVAAGGAAIIPEISGRIEAGLHGEFGQGGYDKYVKPGVANVEGSVGSAVTNVLGGNESPGQYMGTVGMDKSGNMDAAGALKFGEHALGDIGTVALVGGAGTAAARGVGVLSAGGGAADALSAAMTKGAALGLGRSASGAVDAGSAEVASAGGRITNAIQGVGESAPGGPAFREPGFIAKHIGQPFAHAMGTVAQHIPVLGNTGAVVDHIAPAIDASFDVGTEGAGGWYYKARRLASIPYTYKPFALGAETAAKANLFGAAAGGISDLSSGSALSQSVQSEHTFNTLNEKLKRAAGPFGALVDANNLQMVIHAPFHGAHSLSAGVGRAAADNVSTTLRAAQLQGYSGIYQEASGMSQKALEAASGGENEWAKRVTEIANKHAAFYGAEHEVQLDKLAAHELNGLPISLDPTGLAPAEQDAVEHVLGTNLQDVQALRAKAQAIRNDPERLATYNKLLLNERNGDELRHRIARDIWNSRQEAAARGEEWKPGTAPNLGNSQRVSALMSREILPYFPKATDQLPGAIYENWAKYKVGVDGSVVENPRFTVHGGTLDDVVKASFKNPPAADQDMGVAHLTTHTVQSVHRDAQQLDALWDHSTALDKAVSDAEKQARAGGGSMIQDGKRIVVPQTEGAGLMDEMAAEQIAQMEHAPANWQLDWHNTVSPLVTAVGGDVEHMPFKGKEITAALRDWAQALLPSEVNLAEDAPQRLKNAVAALETEHGMKLIAGTDIGHMHVGDETVLNAADDVYSQRKKILNGLGGNPAVTTDRDQTRDVYDNIRHRLQDGMDLRAKHMAEVRAGTRKMSRVRGIDSNVSPDRLLQALNTEGFVDTGHELNLKGVLHRSLDLTKVDKIQDVSDANLRQLAASFLASGRAESEKDAIVLAKSDAADLASRNLMARDLSVKKLMALTDPEKMGRYFPETQNQVVAAAGADAPATVGMLNDKRSVQYMARAIRQGYADSPMRMQGLEKIENVFRANALGFAGTGIMGNQALGRAVAGGLIGGTAGALSNPDQLWKGDFSRVGEGAAIGGLGAAGLGALPGGVKGMAFKDLGWAMANLPNQLAKLRNEFRFELSPEFSLRRIVKSNAKMMAADVGLEPFFNAQKWLEANGGKNALQEGRNALAEAMPEEHAGGTLAEMNRFADDNQKALQSSDIFHLYNQKDREAAIAWQLKRQGMAPSDIRENIIKIMRYGQRDENGVMQSGRSALEKSINTVFFPFSFDKTLYKSLGGFYLDHAAQRVLLTHSLAAYNEYSKQFPDLPGAKEWNDKHLPLMHEIAKLNAFSSGVSAGQFGGVNAPIMQMFLPQSWAATKTSNDTLGRFIPAIKDFGRIFSGQNGQPGVFFQQASILGDQLKTAVGEKAPPAETPYAQLADALDTRRKMREFFAVPLAQNKAAGTTGQKIVFPYEQKYGGQQGQVVSRANIDALIAEQYPAFNPSKGMAIAAADQTAWNKYINTLGQNVPQATVDEHVQFADLVKKVGKKVSDSLGLKPGETGYQDPAAIKAAIDELRSYAVEYATSDPAFYKLYPKLFAGVLGPLERVT